MNDNTKKASVDNLIDANLRQVYNLVLKEDVPDRFTALLEQLKASEGKAPDTPSDAADDEDDNRKGS